MISYVGYILFIHIFVNVVKENTENNSSTGQEDEFTSSKLFFFKLADVDLLLRPTQVFKA